MVLHLLIDSATILYAACLDIAPRPACPAIEVDKKMCRRVVELGHPLVGVKVERATIIMPHPLLGEETEVKNCRIQHAISGSPTIGCDRGSVHGGG